MAQDKTVENLKVGDTDPVDAAFGRVGDFVLRGSVGIDDATTSSGTFVTIGPRKTITVPKMANTFGGNNGNFYASFSGTADATNGSALTIRLQDTPESEVLVSAGNITGTFIDPVVFRGFTSGVELQLRTEGADQVAFRRGMLYIWHKVGEN